jgi:hypothetical protein
MESLCKLIPEDTVIYVLVAGVSKFERMEMISSIKKRLLLRKLFLLSKDLQIGGSGRRVEVLGYDL